MFHEIFLTGEVFTEVVMEHFYLLFCPCLLFAILCIYYFSISLGLFFFFSSLEPV